MGSLARCFTLQIHSYSLRYLLVWCSCYVSTGQCSKRGGGTNPNFCFDFWGFFFISEKSLDRKKVLILTNSLDKGALHCCYHLFLVPDHSFKEPGGTAFVVPCASGKVYAFQIFRLSACSIINTVHQCSSVRSFFPCICHAKEIYFPLAPGFLPVSEIKKSHHSTGEQNIQFKADIISHKLWKGLK